MVFVGLVRSHVGFGNCGSWNFERSRVLSRIRSRSVLRHADGYHLVEALVTSQVPTIPAGTEITCPKCGAHITTTVEDLVPGTELSTEVFGLPESWRGRSIGECADIECDGNFIGPGWKMHTSEGWTR